MVIGETAVADEAELALRFGEEYRLARAETMLKIERSVCGCDYGATSWTTRREALDAAKLLGLKAGVRLLEVGAGSGWPGLYLAGATGCEAILVDLPLDGLKIAKERAVVEKLSKACSIAVADGAALPFVTASLDAIFHSDVLCCLMEKRAVLRECRRVLRPGGRMVFTVISIPQSLSGAARRHAASCGPPFVETAVAYPELLRQAGWRITRQVHLTERYADSVRRQLREEEAHAGELQAILGPTEYADRLGRRRRTLDAIEQGLIQRELFSAI